MEEIETKAPQGWWSRTQVSPEVRRKRERQARSKAPNSAGAISLKKDTPMIASMREQRPSVRSSAMALYCFDVDVTKKRGYRQATVARLLLLLLRVLSSCGTAVMQFTELHSGNFEFSYIIGQCEQVLCLRNII